MNKIEINVKFNSNKLYKASLFQTENKKTFLISFKREDLSELKKIIQT